MRLTAEQIHKQFGSIPALIDVTLSVGPGQAYALLGRNGAGKTTLLNVLGGLVRATSGSVTYDDQALTVDAVALRSRLGILPERDPTLPDLTGRQYLEFVSIVRGLPSFGQNQAAVELALVLLESEGVLDRVARSYSQGMRKKLAICAALISDPDFILLDEPFSNLDPVSCSVLTGVLQGYVRRGVPVIVSSHNLGPVESIATDIGVIDEGRLLLSKPVEEFVEETGSMERSLLETLGIASGDEAL